MQANKSRALWTEARRSHLAGKNNVAFHKLPNEDFGLTEWYTNIRSKKQKNGGKVDSSTQEAAVEDADAHDKFWGTETPTDQSPAGENTQDLSKEESA